jgi:DNA-binding protein HU-alpha
MTEPKRKPKAAPPKAAAAVRAPKAAAKPPKADGMSADAPQARKAAKAAEGVEALRLKDLSDRVAELAGARKALVKPVVEATLRLLGEALEAGRALNLPPLGRARVSRSRATAKGAALTVKLKRGSGQKAGAGPLAEDAEQG